MLPHARFRDIARNLQALDLDETAHYNPFMAAFGVRISSTPITVSFALSSGHSVNSFFSAVFN